jgi:hypothetical protein
MFFEKMVEVVIYGCILQCVISEVQMVKLMLYRYILDLVIIEVQMVELILYKIDAFLISLFEKCKWQSWFFILCSRCILDVVYFRSANGRASSF